MVPPQVRGRHRRVRHRPTEPGTPDGHGGISLTVGKPVAFSPSEYSFGGDKFKYHLKFKMKLVNGAKKPMSLRSTPPFSRVTKRATRSLTPTTWTRAEHQAPSRAPGHVGRWLLRQEPQGSRHGGLDFRVRVRLGPLHHRSGSALRSLDCGKSDMGHAVQMAHRGTVP